MSKDVIVSPESGPKEVEAAASMIPYRRDDVRSKYFGYLSCGFSDEEALYVLGLNRGWLETARQDDKFASLEERIPEFRKELSREYTELDFLRNFRMILEKDHRVIRKSLSMEFEENDEGEMVVAELTPYEHQYLLKLRTAYTPQQLQLLEAVVSGKDGEINFAQWVQDNKDIIQKKSLVQISRTDSITVVKDA